MKLVSGGQLEPADSRNFVGTARVARLPVVERHGGDSTGESVIVYLVEFAAGARTNWHRHSAPQVLLVKEGHGLVQKWGEPVRQIAAGDAVTIEPHEKHWHGAGPDATMTHFAVNLNLTTEWLEPVSDDQYRAS
jgi:quercetin dioxygenase-like cupin family protein